MITDIKIKNKMNRIIRLQFLLVLIFSSQLTVAQTIESKIDSLLQPMFEEEEPGGVFLVAK
jgi:hypothetical protein